MALFDIFKKRNATDSVAYHEFKLRVPIWDISDDDDGDSLAMKSLFSMLSVTPPDSSLASIYDSFYDHSSAKYEGDPWGRIGRGDYCIFLSDQNANVFIAFDMFDEATDQMNTIAIEVSAPRNCACEVAKLMESIRASAEVASALVDGNLGLREAIAINKFPRLVPNHNTTSKQHAQFFRHGSLAYATDS